jgi:hypothetical protein
MFSKKLSIFSKTNVMVSLGHKIGTAMFCENILKIITPAPGHELAVISSSFEPIFNP